MLRADYCIVLHRDLQKELHLKKEGKVCIVLGKWEVSASKILCLHIWKLFTRDENNPIFHYKKPIDLQYLLWEAGTRVPTQRPAKSPISSSVDHLKQKTTIALLKQAELVPPLCCFLLLQPQGAMAPHAASLRDSGEQDVPLRGAFGSNKPFWGDKNPSSSSKLHKTINEGHTVGIYPCCTQKRPGCR